MNVSTGSLKGMPIDPSPVAETAQVERLDGWKLIAAHFGKERTTVIRWARDRGMPVHRMPGGRTGTVYALRHELDRWAGMGRDSNDAPSPPVPKGRAASLSFMHRSGWVLVAVLTVLILAVLGDMFASRAVPHAMSAETALPADARISSRFLAARDLTAERNAAGLEQAILMLEEVTRSAPKFAQGHAALAEALLLSREFGQRPDGEAFLRARQAARTALRLNPRVSEAHRLLGFIAYWADGDFPEAAGRFRQALRLAPTDAMAHFWYGNILSDHGDHAEALRLLRRARLLQPGSVAIQTDLAWARWAAGNDAAAITALQDIVRRHPDFPVAHDCLSIIALFRGDDAGYVRHFTTFAQERGNAPMIARAREIAATFDTRGAYAMHRLLWRYALEDLDQGHVSSEWAAAIASLDHDRAGLLPLLRQAARRGERWGQSGLLRRVEEMWRNDPEIIRHLTSLRELNDRQQVGRLLQPGP